MFSLSSLSFASYWRQTIASAAALIIVGGLIGKAIAQPAESPAADASQVDQLIEQLRDNNNDIRDNATRALIKIGAPAVAKLTKLADDKTQPPSDLALVILRAISRDGVGLKFVSQVKHEGLQGTVTLALSPDGKFVYSPGHIAASVNVFSRNSLTGELQHRQSLVDTAVMDGVVTLHLNSNAKYAVAAACRSKSVLLFRRDERSGELTLLSMRRSEPLRELERMVWPIGAIFSTDDKFVYAIDDRAGLVITFKIDEQHELKLVEIFEGEEFCFNGARGIATSPDGKTLYVNSHRSGTLVVLNRDQTTGKVSIRQIVRDGENGVRGLAGTIHSCVSSDGKFVYTTSGRFEGDDAVSVFQVGADGKLTVLQEFLDGEDLKNFTGGAVGLAISPNGTRLYAAGAKSRSLACFQRDPKSGKLTFLATLQSQGTGEEADLGANGIETSSDGKFLYLALENASAISVFDLTIPKP